MSATWKNLSSRMNHDVIVMLDFSRDKDTEKAIVRVTVNSRHSNDDFVLYPPNDRALDCFDHPYHYLNRVLQSGSYQTVDHGDGSVIRQNLV